MSSILVWRDPNWSPPPAASLRERSIITMASAPSPPMAAGQPSPLTTEEAMLAQLWPETYGSGEQKHQQQPGGGQQAASSIIDPEHDGIQQHSTTSDREIVASLWPEQGRNQ